MVIKRNDDQDWLNALAGQPNSKANPSTLDRAAALRQAIQRYSRQLMGNDYDVESELRRLNDRLSKEGLLDTPPVLNTFAKRWTAFITAILSALAIGAMAMRFAMMPAMEGVRSENTIVSSTLTDRYVQAVSVLTPSPVETMRATVTEAAQLGMDFSVKASGDGYDVTLIGLVSNSPAQETIKQILGLSNSSAGDLQFQIRQKH